jgi:hypothetical protein
MGKAGKEPRLARLTKICLALPEAMRECSSSHAAFRVRKKLFAYFLNDHHGDGIVSVCAKVLPGDNTADRGTACPILYARIYWTERLGSAAPGPGCDRLEGSCGAGGRKLPAHCAETPRRQTINLLRTHLPRCAARYNAVC